MIAKEYLPLAEKTDSKHDIDYCGAGNVLYPSLGAENVGMFTFGNVSRCTN